MHHHHHHHIFIQCKVDKRNFQQRKHTTPQRYIINPKACKRKRLIVCPKAKNNFNEAYFQKLFVQTLCMFENPVKQNLSSSILAMMFLLQSPEGAR